MSRLIKLALPVRGEAGSSLVELMMAVVVMGIVVVGTADGMSMVSRQTTGSRFAVGAVQAAREAVLVLEGLPPNSPYLVDDAVANDLADTETPDFDVDPLNNPAPWTIVASGGNTRKEYRVFFNVFRGNVLTNTAQVRVFVSWDGARPSEFIERTILVPVAP